MVKKKIKKKSKKNLKKIFLDVGNSPTVESIKEYRKYFGDDYFSFWTNGVLNIVINTNLITSEGIKAKQFYEEQINWLTELLEKNRDKAKHILVFQHIPFFLENRDDEDFYFIVPKTQRHKYLELFKKNGVRCVFAG